MAVIKKTLRNYWIVIHEERGQIDSTTVSAYKKSSIAIFIKNTGLTWKELQTYGWTCVKTDISFHITTK